MRKKKFENRIQINTHFLTITILQVTIQFFKKEINNEWKKNVTHAHKKKSMQQFHF